MESESWLKSRGVTFLVGVAVLGLLFHWWLSGTVFRATAFASGEPNSGFSSGGSVFWRFASDAICAVGAVAIALGTRVWDFVWVLIKALVEKAASRSTVVSQVPKALAAIQALHSRLKVLEARDAHTTPPPAATAVPSAKPAAAKAPVKKAAAKPRPKAASKKEAVSDV